LVLCLGLKICYGLSKQLATSDTQANANHV
jgi:hypothetical protein